MLIRMLEECEIGLGKPPVIYLMFYPIQLLHEFIFSIPKGVDFLDAICLVSQKKHWTSDALKEECRKWFSLLLDTVEIKEGAEKVLAHFLTSGKTVTLDKDYRLHIEGEVHSI